MARTIAKGPAPPSRAALAGSQIGQGFGAGFSTGIEEELAREREQEERLRAINPFLEILRADVERSPFVEGGEVRSVPSRVPSPEQIPSVSEITRGAEIPKEQVGVTQDQMRQEFSRSDPMRAMTQRLVQNPETAANLLASDTGAQILTGLVERVTEGQEPPEDVTRITGLLDEAERARRQGQTRRADLLEARAREFAGVGAGDTRQFQTLSPEQAEQVSPALGEMVRGGAIVQRDDRGKLDVTFTPDEDADQRDRKIRDLMTLSDMSREEATKIVDGHKSIEINPETGRVVSIDQSTGEVQEIPIGRSPDIPDIPREDTVFSKIENATGVTSGVQSALGRLPFTEPTEAQQQTLEAREDVRLIQNDIARSLANNPRFPVREREAIIQALDMEPRLFDNPGALRVRMAAADRFLNRRLRLFERDANDPNLPTETRSTQAANAAAMRNAIAQLGVPDTETLQAMQPDQVRALPPEELAFVLDQMSDDELRTLPDEVLQAIAERRPE